jgi:hypothetical protein
MGILPTQAFRQALGKAGPVSSTPLVTVGLLTVDGKGRISGGASGVKAGVMTPVTVTGSYSVDTDCTLTVNADLFVQPQELLTAAAAALVENRIDSITLQGIVPIASGATDAKSGARRRGSAEIRSGCCFNARVTVFNAAEISCLQRAGRSAQRRAAAMSARIAIGFFLARENSLR